MNFDAHVKIDRPVVIQACEDALKFYDILINDSKAKARDDYNEAYVNWSDLSWFQKFFVKKPLDPALPSGRFMITQLDRIELLYDSQIKLTKKLLSCAKSGIIDLYVSGEVWNQVYWASVNLKHHRESKE